MSAWTHLIERGPTLLILALALTAQRGYAAPLEESDQSTEIEYYPVADATGCYYNFEHYDEGDRIITNEPCLNCTCHNRMLMCYLRVCPFTKAIGQDCKVEKKSDQCCPVITCPEVHVQLLPHASTTPSTQVGHPSDYGCTIDNLFYADGAKVPSNPNNPCEVCYCIRNKTACIIQDCTLTGKVVEGCLPVYVDGVCCPVRYDCDHPELETTPRPLLTTTTTTLPPTTAPYDCIFNNEVYSDGALVKKDIPCEQCYCMRGDIVCAVQECGPTPLDKVNCTALLPKEGQCCPDTYECDNLSEEDLTTISYYDVSTTPSTVISPDEGTAVTEQEDALTTKAPTPLITISDDQLTAETEGIVSESTTKTIPEESPVTESVTFESVTSRITQAVEAVTSKVTEMVETITSTIIGSEQDTTSNLDIITAGTKESEATTVQSVEHDASERITEKSPEQEQPATEYEEHTDHGLIVTEGINQGTEVPESDDQKLLVTISEEIEHKPTEGLTNVEEVATESAEPVHDDHEETDQEETPHEDEGEVTEGSGETTKEQEAVGTQTPELDAGDKLTSPIEGEIHEKPHTTEQSELESTSSPMETVPHVEENELIEGSGAEKEQEPIGTLPPESETQHPITKEPESELTTSSKVEEEPERIGVTGPPIEPEIGTTGTLTTDSSEEETSVEPVHKVTPVVTEQPEQDNITEELITPVYCSDEGCQQTVQPLEPATTTTKPEAEITVVPEVETPIPEQEQPHADVTKEPEEALVTEKTETQFPKEIPTTESVISESVKPDVNEEVTEPEETTTTLSSVQEPTTIETEHVKDILPVEPAVTEVIPITETQRMETEVMQEEQKPTLDNKEKEHTTTEKDEEEEMQFVTEIPTKEPEKPQAMDHVSETISSEQTSTRPESHETEKSVETETTDEATELPKSSETTEPHVTEPESEQPIEPNTHLYENKTSEVTTESISGITEVAVGISETPVICDTDKGCISAPEESSKTPEVSESCTKENCISQGQVPPSEPGTETGHEIPVSCDSEHGCAPTSEQGGVNVTDKVPGEDTSVGCNTEDGCTAVGPEKEAHIPEITVPEGCDNETGCAPVTEKEIEQVIDTKPEGPIFKPCADETGCIPVLPGKEGEEPVTESGEITKLPDSATTSDEIVPHTVIPSDAEGSGQPPILSETTKKPEEADLTEGSGHEDIEGSGHIPSEATKEEQATEEAIVHDKEPSEDEVTKEVQPEISTEGEQTVTITPVYESDIGNEIEPESTSAPEQTEFEETQTPGEIPSEGTPAPESIAPVHAFSTQSPEIITQHIPDVTIFEENETPGLVPDVTRAPESSATESTEIPEVTLFMENETPGPVPDVTKAPESSVTEGTEIPEVTEVPIYIAPETTLPPEKVYSEGTIIPDNISTSTETQEGENDIFPEGTQTPEHIKPEGTRVPDENLPESTDHPEPLEPTATETPQEAIPVITEVPGQELAEDTQSPERGITSVTGIPEEIVPEGTKYPETTQDVSKGTQVSEETTEESVTPDHIGIEGTKSPEEISPEGTPEPEVGITHGPKDTELLTEGTESPEQTISQTGQPTQEISTGSTEIPEGTFEGTQENEEAPFESTQTPEEAIPEVTHTTLGSYESTQKPEQITPEGTLSSVESESGESTVPESTQTPEEIIPTGTYSPETDTAEQDTITPEQILSVSTEIPGEVTEKILYDHTLVPEQISPEATEQAISQDTQSPEEALPESAHATEYPLPETTQTPVSKAPEIETSETTEENIFESTQVPEKTVSEEVQLPEHAATDVPEATQVPVQAATDSEIIPEVKTTETIPSETTSAPEKIATESPEQTATDVPKLSEVTHVPVQVIPESGTEGSPLVTEEEEHGIPGEGNCLVDGKTYKNNSNVPPINQCQTACRCVSSILQCESVSCTPPPSNLQDCMPIFHSPDSCCPVYSCSVPGVTSMESDSHVVETTTSGHEDEKPVTIGIQVIPSEEAIATEKSTAVTISSEEITTIKHAEEGISATEETEITPAVPVITDVIRESTTPKATEGETEVPESISTQKTVISQNDTLPEAETEVNIPETATKEYPVPESQTGIPGTETTDVVTETKETITEPSVKPVEGEEYPEHDVIENEIPEVPTISEHCGDEGCEPVSPTEESQLPEKTVTEAAKEEIDHTVTITQGEVTEKQQETYTDKPKVTIIDTTETEVTESAIQTDLPSSKIPAATDQSVTDEYATPEHITPSDETSTDKQLPESIGSTVTEQTVETEPSSETELPKISDYGTAVPESSSDYTNLPEHITESITEAKPSEGEHVPPESPITEQTSEEISTESTKSEETSESATEAISEETKSPEEIAVVPELEEAATSSPILPESITETIGEATSPTEKQPEEVETKQPIDEIETELSTKPEIATEVQEPDVTPIPESSAKPETATEFQESEATPEPDIPAKPETATEFQESEVTPEPETPAKPETATEFEESYVTPEHEVTATEVPETHEEGSTESQPEIRYPDRVSTAGPESDVHVTESLETLQTTTSSILEHITEFEELHTHEPIETSAQVTEAAEVESEQTATPLVEVGPESTSKQSVEEPTEISEEVKTEIVPQQEAKPEEETATESHVPTVSSVGQETSTVAKSEDQPITVSDEITKVTQPTLHEKQTETEGPAAPVTEGGITTDKENEEPVTESEKEDEEFPTHAPVETETGVDYTPSVTEKEIVESITVTSIATETPIAETEKTETEPVASTEKVEEGAFTSPQLTTQGPSNISEPYTSVYEELSTKKSVEGELSTSMTASVEPSTAAPTYAPAPVPGHEIPGEHVPEIPDYQTPGDDYEDEDQSPLGPGTCRYGGKVYVSAQQIPRDDPCDFCFCFRSDIICLQQSCPPPIPRCHEEPIRGFCCPRYECPVGMATAVNVTTSTTTTTTTLPPHFLSHAYKGRVTRSGCQVDGRAYQVGEFIKSASGPCLHCTCGGDGEMKCDPKACSPEPMLRQMIAAAASRRRR